MKIAAFPGLGLEFHLNPILLPITDGFGIHWYGLIIAVGFLLAVLWGCRQASQFGIKQDDVIDMLFFTVPLAIIGARLYYVAFEFRHLYYVPGDPLETLRRIVRIWDGGLAIYGAVIAAALTLLVFCKVKKINFPAFADVGCMGLFIGQCIGRWGNFVNVEAFGSVTGLRWRMSGPDVAGFLKNQVDPQTYQAILDGTLGVHPTFLYESLWNLAGFLVVVLLVKKHRKFDGQLFLSYIAWYGVGRFFIEGLRTDSLTIGPLRISQVLALVSALAALGVMVYVLRVKKPTPEQLYVNRILLETPLETVPEKATGTAEAEEEVSQPEETAPETQAQKEEDDDAHEA